MRTRRILAIAAAVGTTLSLSATASAADTVSDELSTATVHIEGMYDIRQEVDLSKLPSETFTVTGPADQIDALVGARVGAFNQKLEMKTRRSSLGVTSPLARDERFGNCGSSYVLLRATGSYVQGQGYLEAGWWINPTWASAATTYDSNVLFFSTSHFDGHTQNFPDFGVMNSDSRTWSTRVTIPKKQEYGATMNVGRVNIVRASDGQPSTCVTKGPSVNNVLLYK